MNFFDWHCDTLAKIEKNQACDVNKGTLEYFETAVQTFAIYTPDRLPEEEAYTSAKKKAHIFSELDFDNRILSIENCKMLKDESKTLEEFFELGAFLFSLTHNADNKFAGGCDGDNGISVKGRELLKTASKLGMTLDVSHLSFKAFYEAIDLFDGLVVASHSCFSKVCEHRRNLTDEMAKLIFQKGGFIGINIYTPFVGGNTLKDVVRHFEHGCDLGGEAHLAFGCDMDGIDMMPADMSHYGDIIKIIEIMREKGFSEAQISGIFYDNSYNFLKENDYLGFLQHKKL